MEQSVSRLRWKRTIFWGGGVFLLLTLAFGGMIYRMNYTPMDMDLSTTRTSENGLFIVTYSASTGAVPINQIHEWTLHVENAAGGIVENAEIRVDGDMPQHGHGLPTQPRVTKYLGGGDYLVEGLRFQMGGWWVMDFTITADGQSDTVHFDMMLR
jgi:hypothetical protein